MTTSLSRSFDTASARVYPAHGGPAPDPDGESRAIRDARALLDAPRVVLEQALAPSNSNTPTGWAKDRVLLKRPDDGARDVTMVGGPTTRYTPVWALGQRMDAQRLAGLGAHQQGWITARPTVLVAVGSKSDLRALGLPTRRAGVWIALDGPASRLRADCDRVVPPVVSTWIPFAPSAWAGAHLMEQAAGVEPSLRDPVATALPMSVLITGGAWTQTLAADIAAGRGLGAEDPERPGRTVVTVALDGVEAFTRSIEQHLDGGMRTRGPIGRAVVGLWHRTLGGGGAPERFDTAVAEAVAPRFAAVRDLMGLMAVLIADGVPLGGADAERVAPLAQRLDRAVGRLEEITGEAKRAWTFGGWPPLVEQEAVRAVLRAAADAPAPGERRRRRL